MTAQYVGKHRAGICSVCAHSVRIASGVATEHRRRSGGSERRCEGSGQATWKPLR